MIVRCTSCVSAFAVDDEKVANRKFAFTCPKCGTENIFDNRKHEEKHPSEEMFFEEEIKKPSSEEIPFEHDLGSEEAFFDELPAPDKKEKKGLNLELEETSPAEEEISFDDDFLIEDKPAKKGAPAEEEISFDEDELFAEEKPAKKETPFEEEILFEEDELPAEEKPVKKTAAPEEELISFDEDELFAEEKPAKKETPLEEEILFEEDELPAEEKPAKKGAAPEEELISFDEDELFAEEKPAKKETPLEDEILFEEDELTAEEKPAKKTAAPEEELISFDEDELFAEEKPAKKEAPLEKEILFEDEFIIDESESPEDVKKAEQADDELLEIGLELEDESPAKVTGDRDIKMSSQDDIDALFADLPSEDETPAVAGAKKTLLPEDDITVNLDELDIELEGDIQPAGDEFVSFDDTGEPSEKKAHEEEEPVFDDDITIDMDSLDIDIEEAGDLHKPVTEEGKLPEELIGDEEDLVLNIDEFDEGFGDEVKAPAIKSSGKATPPEDDITLDLDSLDIELDESEAQPVSSKKVTESLSADDEEDLKLNLDEMDMDIEELEKKELVFDDDIFAEPEAKPKKKGVLIEESDEDESITIDLETLDIEVAESPELMTGEMTEEDEKLTLDDAGLTFSELAEEERGSEPAGGDEDELFLSLDEIDPDLKLQVIGEEAPKGEKPLSETVQDLPEIDLDEYEAVIREEKLRPEKETFEQIEGLDDLDEFENIDIPAERSRALDLDILEYEEEAEDRYAPERGSTTFSIDYSLKYSRLGAFLRLIGLYILSMIPHFIVMLIYTILSGILGFINQIVILSTGRCVEDFSLITENTLRYFLYIKSNITGIVEDRPVYAGRESLSHQLQLNITYPVKYSRNLAILRLSIIGIWLITIPHFIIMSLLTIAVPFVYLAGIITVIATRRWPNPLFIFLTRYFRYLARISSFLLGLTDEYPPFRFD